MIETAVRPRPVGRAPEKPALIEYQRLCDELDFHCPQALGPALEALIRAHCLPVYDTAEVEAYLEAIRPPGRSVVWKRLNGWDQGEGQRYHLPVPLHILRRAATLFRADRRLVFEVSDFDDPNADPFLSVRRREMKQRFVIGAWDEPAFEGTPEL
jgi:hypothetical protein